MCAGRARAEDSSYIVVAQKKVRGGAQQKEEVNAIREELMATALQKIARMSPADFNHRMKDAQRQIDKEQIGRASCRERV